MLSMMGVPRGALIKGLDNYLQTSRILYIGEVRLGGRAENISWGDKKSASVRCRPFSFIHLHLDLSVIPFHLFQILF